MPLRKIVDKVIVTPPFLSRQERPPDMKKGSCTLHGTVFTGSGRGAYYVGHTEDDIRQRKRLRLRVEGLRIEEFHVAGERFSTVNCFKGRLEDQAIALLIVEITDSDDSVLELISPVYLRQMLRLKDGSAVSPTIEYYSR